MAKTNAPPIRNITGIELSKLFDCTPQYLAELENKGLPKDSLGKYNEYEAIPWYINHLRNAKKTDEAQSRARKLAAEAQLKEFELRMKQENLISVEDATLEVSEIFSAIRSQILALPSRVAPQLMTCSTAAEAEGLMLKLVNQTLEELTSLPERLEALQDESKDNQLSESSTSDTEANTQTATNSNPK